LVRTFQLSLPQSFYQRSLIASLYNILGGAVIFLGMPLYASVVLIGAARFLETSLNLNFKIALIIMALIVAVYVVMGSIRGVMYTDTLQGTIMFFGMILLVLSVYYMLGGAISAHEALTSMGASHVRICEECGCNRLD